MSLAGRLADAVVAFATDIKLVLAGLASHKESATAHAAESIVLDPPISIGSAPPVPANNVRTSIQLLTDRVAAIGESNYQALTLLEIDVELPVDGQGTENTIFIRTRSSDYEQKAFTWIPRTNIDPEDPESYDGGYWEQILRPPAPEVPEVPVVTAADVTLRSGGADGVVIGTDPYSEVRFLTVNDAIDQLAYYTRYFEPLFVTSDQLAPGAPWGYSLKKQRKLYITIDTNEIYHYDGSVYVLLAAAAPGGPALPFIAFGFDSETPSQAQALGYLTVSIGHNAGLDNPSNDDINIGTNAGRGVAYGGEGIYIGKDAGWGSYGERSVILGRNALKGNGLPNAAAATQSVAIGDEAAIGGNLFNSVVIGMQAGVLAADNSSVIIGYRSNWGEGSDSCVYIGREVIGATPGENLTQAFGAVGIGYKAHPKSRDDVALGSYSTTDEVTTVTPSYVIRETTYTFANGATNPTSSVSFGTADMKRPILNLAAGRISETSTDAVNGSQLHAVITAVNAMGDSVNVSTDSNIDGGEPSTVYGGTLLVDGGTP